MWLARRFALTAITRTIRMLARPMATTVRAILRTGSLSAQGPGTTAGDVRIMNAATVAALTADLRDAVLRDMVRGMVRWLGVASKGAVRSRATAEGSMVGAAANPIPTAPEIDERLA